MKEKKVYLLFIVLALAIAIGSVAYAGRTFMSLTGCGISRKTDPSGKPCLTISEAMAIAKERMLEHKIDLSEYYIKSASFSVTRKHWVVVWATPKDKEYDDIMKYVHCDISDTTKDNYRGYIPSRYKKEASNKSIQRTAKRRGR